MPDSMTEHGRQASVTQRGSPDSTRRPFITIIKINTLILIIATARAIPMITMIYRNTLASECRQRLGLQHHQTHETALAGSSTGEVEVRTASADRCVVTAVQQSFNQPFGLCFCNQAIPATAGSCSKSLSSPPETLNPPKLYMPN